MTRQPDEDYDVIVYEYRHTWAIWLGDELQEGSRWGRCSTVACFVVAVHRRPAWLLDETGYPLQPIEL